MSPETHLLASWLIAAKTTRTPRDCRLVALAGILPDADGLGLLVDTISKASGHPTALYQNYHHWLLHGIFGAIVISAILSLFATQRWRVLLLAFGVFHLHLLCDLLGSRGPTADDLWPIYYLGPFSRTPVWIWHGQWRLDGWQNRYISIALFAAALWIPIKRGESVVGIFNRHADAVLVSILRKWRAQICTSRLWLRIAQPFWRTIVPSFCIIGFAIAQYSLWQPGLDIRDGEHDRRHNGIWISHGWLGSNEWFVQNQKTNEITLYRSNEHIRELREKLKRDHITDVFPHLCPTDERGNLPKMDDSQTERFLNEFAGFRVMPWIGGPNGPSFRYRDPKWKSPFLASVSNLFATHPRFSGIHLNVEPLPSGDQDFLNFLTELRSVLPKQKQLSIAAYPPPTRWHPYPDVHWDEAYFRDVSRRSDQLVVMLYDTSLHNRKFYQKLMADWTEEVLRWSEGKRVLLGVPTYKDADVPYHDPMVENIENALLGIHQGLSERPFGQSYQGIAIYSEWETDPTEWAYLREHFLKR